MKFLLSSFFSNFLKTNKNNIEMKDIILNNILSSINFTKEYFEILDKFDKSNLLPKDVFYQIYHVENSFNKKQGLHNLNFVNKEPDITFKDKYYPNRKIYYLLNEYENIIYFKFVDKFLETNISLEYKTEILKLLENLEEQEIKALDEKTSKYFTRENIIKKFEEIKNLIITFDEKLNKELNNYLIKSSILIELKKEYNLNNNKIINILNNKNSFIKNKFNKLNKIKENFNFENKEQLKSNEEIEYF